MGAVSRAAAQGLWGLGTLVAAPVALALVALRPGWRVGLRERLGAVPRLAPGAVWVHGASVGEILAATRLVDRLRESGRPVFASTTTTSGREVVRASRPDVPSALAPLDHPWCAAAALARVRPRALLLVETELWPSWIAAADRADVPVLVVSGRLSDRSFPRYRRLRHLLRGTLRRLSAVGARSAEDAERFVALGVPPERVRVTGDLKLEPPATAPRAAADLDAALGDAPLVVAGSTHPGEEAAALGALEAAEAAGLRAALLLAPRRIERAPEVAELAAGRGRTVRRRTALAGARLAPGEVLLLDTLGELAAVYARASVAFVGGTLAPVGGHNLLEPAQAGRPVLFGPHCENARAAAELLRASGAGQCVADPAALARAVVAALRDPDAGRARGARARARLEEHRGSAERAVALLDEVLRVRAGAAATGPAVAAGEA